MGAGSTALMASGLVSSLAGQYVSAKSQQMQLKNQAESYARQQQILAVQQEITDSQYENKKRSTAGSYEASASHGGVKVSGSVAESLSQSLRQINLEHAYTKFNNQVETISAQASESVSLRNAKAVQSSMYLNMGSTLLGGVGRSSQYW